MINFHDRNLVSNIFRIILVKQSLFYNDIYFMHVKTEDISNQPALINLHSAC